MGWVDHPPQSARAVRAGMPDMPVGCPKHRNRGKLLRALVILAGALDPGYVLTPGRGEMWALAAAIVNVCMFEAP